MLNWFLRNRVFLIPCLLALFWLTAAKFLIVFIPFRQWRSLCGVYQCETLRPDMSGARRRILQVRYAVMFMSKYMPWKSKCLDRAIAAQQLLKRHGFSTTLFIGMVKNEEQAWGAHAWVRCGDIWVVGYQPGVAYTTVGVYALVA